jgi:hypothetical protein
MKQQKEAEVVRIAQYDDSQGLTLQAAVQAVGQRHLRLLSNQELDQRLVDSDVWKKEKEMYPAWSGTFIAYERPGVAFGKTVSFRDLVVAVPKQFQGKVNCALVCNHPDFTLKDNKITLGKTARCLPFPVGDGWYLPDKDFGIPCLEKSNSLNSAARYLWRYTSLSYAGLVVRGGYGLIFCLRRDVLADGCYCYFDGFRFGVFGSSVGAAKKGKCKHKFVCEFCGEKRK